MSKYRIKIVTYKDGNTKYFPQYYVGFFYWGGLFSDGAECLTAPDINYEWSRERALEVIDRAEKGAGKVRTIEFEYINK